MTLEELLSLKGKEVKITSVEMWRIYDFGVIAKLLDNEFFLVDVYENYSLFEDIFSKFTKVIYRDGRQSNIEVGIVKYEDTPIVLYESYHDSSFWHVNPLNDLCFKIMEQLRTILTKIYMDRDKTKYQSLEWLSRYEACDGDEGVIEEKR